MVVAVPVMALMAPLVSDQAWYAWPEAGVGLDVADGDGLAVTEGVLVWYLQSPQPFHLTRLI
jgi:hypothetical protein